MTWLRIALVSVAALLALEGAVMALAPDEVRAFLSDMEPGLLRLIGMLECIVAVALLAACFLA